MAYTTINKSTDYFNTKLYTGNGSTQSITGVGFQPDFCWFKNRTSAQSHVIVDSIRGRAGLQPNETNPEYALNSGRDFGTFDSDGFTVLNPEQYNSFNYNTGSIVSWNWLGANGTTANTDGSISSTVSANTTSGFSIVKWSGTGSSATLGHGLGIAPSMIITKSLGSSAWGVYNENLGNTKVLFLDESGANGTNIAYWNNTSPTSSVFTVGSDAAVNHSGNDMIAYCFANVKGFSKMGSYTGNGNADGSFIYTGFSPAFVMIKETTGTGKWVMKDNRRTGINVNQSTIYANEPEAEGTPGYELIDLLSNGFKQRGTGSYVNGSGTPYIFMAFAEAPLVGSNNVPATAK
jgi:hypothetical protein